jgi:hypothetical protein
MTTSPDDRSRNTEPETTVAGDVPCQPVAAIIRADGQARALAFRAVRKGGSVVCAGIDVSEIPAFSYDLLRGGRAVGSMANRTRRTGSSSLPWRPLDDQLVRRCSVAAPRKRASTMQTNTMPRSRTSSPVTCAEDVTSLMASTAYESGSTSDSPESTPIMWSRGSKRPHRRTCGNANNGMKLRAVAHAPAQRGGTGGQPENAHESAAHDLDSDYCAHQGGLAAAAGPDEPGHCPGGDREVDAMQDLPATALDVQRGHDDGRLSRAPYGPSVPTVGRV